MARLDELRLMAKVARMYYLQELNQQAITDKLQIHQSTISRMLKRARAMNLVRFSIAAPPGTFAVRYLRHRLTDLDGQPCVGQTDLQCCVLYKTYNPIKGAG